MALVVKRKNYQRNRGTSLQIVRDTYGHDWRTRSKETRARDRKCVACGETENLEVHHIKELSHGGRTTNFNTLSLCQRCHNKRHKHLRHRK